MFMAVSNDLGIKDTTPQGRKRRVAEMLWTSALPELRKASLFFCNTQSVADYTLQAQSRGGNTARAETAQREDSGQITSSSSSSSSSNNSEGSGDDYRPFAFESARADVATSAARIARIEDGERRETMRKSQGGKRKVSLI